MKGRGGGKSRNCGVADAIPVIFGKVPQRRGDGRRPFGRWLLPTSDTFTLSPEGGVIPCDPFAIEIAVPRNPSLALPPSPPDQDSRP